jgi:hypothetical protein
MFTTSRGGGLRRMSLEELIAKLAQIEEHASVALSEHPRGQILPRMRLILGIAKQARLQLENQVNSGARVAMAPGAPAHTEQPAIQP